jgi:hypothetical protein
MGLGFNVFHGTETHFMTGQFHLSSHSTQWYNCPELNSDVDVH